MIETITALALFTPAIMAWVHLHVQLIIDHCQENENEKQDRVNPDYRNRTHSHRHARHLGRMANGQHGNRLVERVR